MDYFVNDVSETIDRELARLIGYRLLGWSIVSLWAVAVVILFRLFQAYPPAIEKWLFWVSPLLIIRSIGAVFVHKQLRAGINIPTPEAMRRMSLLFGAADGVVFLSGALLLFSGGAAGAFTLLFFVTAFLALTAFVYMYTPWVAPAVMGLVGVPALGLAFYRGISLPPELLFCCISVLVATCLGVNRFKTLYLRTMQDKLRYQHDIYQAAESNFIFNEHWQKMHVAAIDWDRDCVIRSWNPAAERLFGVRADEAKGHSLELLFERETAADIRSQWLHATEDKYEPPVVRVQEQLPGQPVTCWYDTPLFHDGELIGIASFVIDMSERPVGRQRQRGASLADLFKLGDSRAFSPASHGSREALAGNH